MAGCSSLVELSRQCGAEGIVGGTEKLYMISFADTTVPDGATGDEIYTVSEGGLISDIGIETGKSFVEVGILKSTVGIKETLTKDPSVGSAYFTQEMPLVLAGLSSDNRTFVESVLNQPVVAIVKSRNGKYFAAGLNGQLELSSLEGGTGTAEGDLNGYNLTFSGISNKLIYQVDSTIITSLLETAA